MQKLVKTTLCIGVVSLTLVACGDDVQEDTNIITLDQLDSLADDVVEVDSTVVNSGDNIDPDGNREFELHDEKMQEIDENVEKEAE